MIYVALAVMPVLLVEAALALHVADDVRGIFASSRRAVAILAAPDQDDAVKERAARAGALAVFRHTLLFTVRVAVIAALMLSACGAVILLTPVSPEQFMETAMSFWALVGLTALGILYVRLRHVRHR